MSWVKKTSTAATRQTLSI